MDGISVHDLIASAVEILKLGPAGLIIAVLCVAVYKLFQKYDLIQQRRSEENAKNQEILADLTQALQDLTEAHKELAREVRDWGTSRGRR